MTPFRSLLVNFSILIYFWFCFLLFFLHWTLKKLSSRSLCLSGLALFDVRSRCSAVVSLTSASWGLKRAASGHSPTPRFQSALFFLFFLNSTSPFNPWPDSMTRSRYYECLFTCAAARKESDICFPFARAVQIGWWDLWHFSEKSLLWRDSRSGFSHAFFFSLTSHPKLLCLPPLDWKVWLLCSHSFSDSKGSHSFLWGVFFFSFSCPA